MQKLPNFWREITDLQQSGALCWNDLRFDPILTTTLCVSGKL